MRNDSSQFWVCGWSWKGGPRPPDAAYRFGPAFYPSQMRKFSPEQVSKWNAEIDLWEQNQFIVKVNRDDIDSNIPLMLISQEHKLSTPVRPVLNYKNLNNYIKSYPNSDTKLVCSDTIRRWRIAKDVKFVLKDISKAYLRIFMVDENSRFQGIIRVSPNGEHSYFKLTRLGFGISIAPKVLRCVLKFILNEHSLSDCCDFFVDDLKIEQDRESEVTNALQENGFPTKPSEVFDEAKCLGLLRHGPMWKRRSEIVEFNGVTFRDLKSWVAIIATSHFPVIGQLRLIARSIERNANVRYPDAKLDDILPGVLHQMARDLYAWVNTNGDPTTGVWSVDVSGKWEMYTDASGIGLGCCLKINGVVVEDCSWLRKLGDVRPIDLAELESVLFAFNRLLLPWLKAAGGNRSVDVYVDNYPTLHQLQRKQQAHSKCAKGLSSGANEVRLQLIEDLIRLNNLEVQFHYVESSKNIADCLTRIPAEFMWPVEKLHRCNKSCYTEEIVVGAQLLETSSWRENCHTENSETYVVPEKFVMEFLNDYHRQYHLSVQPMYEKLRRWVKIDGTCGLLESIRAVVYSCETCAASKSTPNQHGDLLTVRGKKQRISKASRRVAKLPFDKLHMDIVGPYRIVENKYSFYAICLVDSASNFAFTKSCRTTPKTTEIIELLDEAIAFSNKIPLVIVSDGGANMVSNEMLQYFVDRNMRQQVTAKGSSLTNGRVERFNRSLNEYLRCHLLSDTPYYKFEAQIKRATRVLNTTPRGAGVSPHEKVFRFAPEIDSFKPLNIRPHFDVLCLDKVSTWGIGFKRGTVVMMKNQNVKKLTPRWSEAIVQDRVGFKTYVLEGLPGKYDLKDLKPTVRTEYVDAVEEVTDSVVEESEKSQSDDDDSSSGSNF
jgi:hypothetical protein